jgi:site-specific recombinase XerD
MPCSINRRTIDFAGESYELPVLKDSQGRYLEEANEWLHEQVLYGRIESSSGFTYAEHLAGLFTYFDEHHCDLSRLHDYDLRAWMNSQAKRGVVRDVIRARRDAVFRFAMWLCDHGHPGLVRLPGRDYPPGFVPRLSGKVIRAHRGRRYSVEAFVSAVGVPGKPSPKQATPSTDEVAKLRVISEEHFPNKVASEWHHLLLSWEHDAALRRSEFAALKLAQIPNEHEIDALVLGATVYELHLTETKGSKPRTVGILPTLLQNTRDYIEGARKDIVRRMRAKHAKYVEPEHVFLSSKTGMAFAPRSISNLLRTLFRAADVAGHGHRIRATSLTNLFNAEYEAAVAARNSQPPELRMPIDFELILLRVAERAGHKEPETLRPYLNLLKKRYEREIGVDNAVNMELYVRSLKVEVAGLEARKATLLKDIAALSEGESRGTARAGAGSVPGARL